MKRFQMFLPDDERKKLERLAKKMKLSLAALIRLAIERYIEQAGI